MGAWNCGVFDDDTAYDVMDELKDCENVVAYLEHCFDTVAELDYLEYDDGISVAVCGAVLDSVLNGTGYRFDGFNGSSESGVDGSRQYLDWIATKQNAGFGHLKPKAVKALEKLVGENSELRELWSDNKEYFPKWQAVYTEMMGRLQ